MLMIGRSHGGETDVYFKFYWHLHDDVLGWTGCLQLEVDILGSWLAICKLDTVATETRFSVSVEWKLKEVLDSLPRLIPRLPPINRFDENLNTLNI